MHRDPESNDESRGFSESLPYDPDREDAENQRTFRHWMDVNEQSLRVFLLIAAYASLMLYLVSLVLLGGPSVLTKIFSGIIVGSLFVVYLLFRFSLPVDQEGRTIWRIYRSSKKERRKKRIAVILWSFIAFGFLLALIWSRLGHPR
jgi:polyferredoxin